MIDLHNARAETISVAEMKSAQDCAPSLKLSKLTDDDCTSAKSRTKIDSSRRSSTNSDKSLDAEDDDDKETQYRLDPK